MIATAGGGLGLRARLDRVARRYEPVAVTLAVCLAVLHLVDPIPFRMPGSMGIAPFASAGGTADPGTPAGGGAPPAESALPATAGVTPFPPLPGSVTEPSGVGSVGASDPITGGDATPPPVAGTDPSVALFAPHPAPGGAGGVTVAGRTVVATLADGESGLAVLSRGGELQHTIDVPADGLTAVGALDDDEVVVAASRPADVLAVDLGDRTVRKLATIPDVGPCVPIVRTRDCDAVPVGAAPLPWAVAVGPAGAVYVGDAGQGAIWRIPAGGGEAEQWLVDSTFASVDGRSGPVGLALDGAGDLVVALPRRLTDDRGEVVVVEVADDGTAGEQRTVAVLAAGERPAGMALDESGGILLTLPATRELLVLDAQGAEVARVAVDPDLGGGELTGIALLGDDDVLVAGRRVGEATKTAIVRVAGIRSPS